MNDDYVSPSDTYASPQEWMMRHAVVIARQNPECPFGCVIVDENFEIVAEGMNRRRENPIWHSEIDAINECARSHPNIDWSRLTLYTTVEPCPMCMSAILWAGIGSVVFGVSIETLVKLGWHQIEIPSSEVAAKSWYRDFSIRGGLLEEKCKRLFEPMAQADA